MQKLNKCLADHATSLEMCLRGRAAIHYKVDLEIDFSNALR